MRWKPYFLFCERLNFLCIPKYCCTGQARQKKHQHQRKPSRDVYFPQRGGMRHVIITENDFCFVLSHSVISHFYYPLCIRLPLRSLSLSASRHVRSHTHFNICGLANASHRNVFSFHVLKERRRVRLVNGSQRRKGKEKKAQLYMVKSGLRKSRRPMCFPAVLLYSSIITLSVLLHLLLYFPRDF